MGEHVSETITIAAPVSTVLEVITTLEGYPDWVEGMTDAQVLSRDAEGRPATARFRVDAKVAEVVYTLRYSYDEHRVSWTLEEGETLSQLDGSYDLEPDGAGTVVRYELEVDVDLPVPSYLTKRAAKRILEQGMSGLRRRAETRR